LAVTWFWFDENHGVDTTVALFAATCIANWFIFPIVLLPFLKYLNFNY